MAIALGNRPPFSRTAIEVWRRVHAIAMMAGSIAVLIGFLVGIMHSAIPKTEQKRAGSTFRLPPPNRLKIGLEMSCRSTVAVGIGLIAGVVMNLNRWGSVGWTDQVFCLAHCCWSGCWWRLALTAFCKPWQESSLSHDGQWWFSGAGNDWCSDDTTWPI